MMNKLKEVLEVLGLEVGKEYYLFSVEERFPSEFLIDKGGYILRKTITEDTQSNAKKENWYLSKVSLLDLINGTLRLEPASFIPKYGEQYWSFSNMGNMGHITFNNDTFDLFRLATGFCFRTEQEAIDNKEKFAEMMEAIRNGAKLVLKRGYE